MVKEIPPHTKSLLIQQLKYLGLEYQKTIVVILQALRTLQNMSFFTMRKSFISQMKEVPKFLTKPIGALWKGIQVMSTKITHKPLKYRIFRKKSDSVQWEKDHTIAVCFIWQHFLEWLCCTLVFWKELSLDMKSLLLKD